MAITIKPEFLTEVKKHIRVLHNEDDDLISNEIEVAILNIYTQFMLKQEADIPPNTDGISSRAKLAVKHLVARWRTNPDGSLQSNIQVYDKLTIERILGNELGFHTEK